MAGTVLERLSGKKLFVLCLFLFSCLFVCFLIGGLIAPAPTNAQQILGTTCLDKEKIFNNKSGLIFLRPSSKSNCEFFDMDQMDETDLKYKNIEPEDVIFVFQIPLPKDGRDLDMSRWFNSMLSILMLDIEYREGVKLTSKYIRIEAKLAYRSKWEAAHRWTLMAHSLQDRSLNCRIDEHQKVEGYYYNCSTLPFFELGNVYHDYYLVNLRIPVDVRAGINTGIGKVKDVWLVEIHQNGGFTRVWFALKTIWWPTVFLTAVWYWNRIRKLARPASLLDKTLLALAGATTLLNTPIDWFILWFDMPYMLFYSDIRQGLFYLVLFVFWVIFAGEHLIDDVPRNRLSAYWKHLGGVCFGCLCLFVFELCERGVELRDPFFSLWATEVGTRVALAFISVAGICAALYFTFLCYMIYCVFKNISKKRLYLPQMAKPIKLKYEGIIYRFKFLMLATLACAAMTVIFFMVSQVSENHWKWTSKTRLEYTSAFYTGVYGMWNIYVLAVLVFYAPSHKTKSDDLTDEQECIEIDHVIAPANQEVSALTAFLKKETQE